MGLPLAALLPIGGAVLGGVEGYKKSGGDVGAALLGSGLGALGGGGLRMAGMGLAGTALANNAVYKTLAQKAAKGTLTAAEAGTLQAITKGAGLAGAGAGLAALPLASNVAGGVAGGLKGPAQAAAQTGAGLVGYTTGGQPIYGNIGGGAVPPVGQYGGMSPYGSPLDVLGPAGMGQRLQTIKDAETMRDAMRLLNPEILAASEARSKKEFERNMAAAGIRQNIATRAAMIQNAQRAGLESGMTAARQAGDALTRQYQYQ
jgi:hypothetical protein